MILSAPSQLVRGACPCLTECVRMLVSAGRVSARQSVSLGNQSINRSSGQSLATKTTERLKGGLGRTDGQKGTDWAGLGKQDGWSSRILLLALLLLPRLASLLSPRPTLAPATSIFPPSLTLAAAGLADGATATPVGCQEVD